MVQQFSIYFCSLQTSYQGWRSTWIRTTSATTIVGGYRDPENLKSQLKVDSHKHGDMDVGEKEPLYTTNKRSVWPHRFLIVGGFGMSV